MADDECLDINGKLIYDLRVADLKKELDKRALSKTGNKKELVERLKAHHQKEVTNKEHKQMLIEKYRTHAPGDDSDEDEDAPNLLLPNDASQNELLNEYLARRRQQLQEQSDAKKEWDDEGSDNGTNDEVTSPTKETANNHPSDKDNRVIHLTHGGLAKLKPANNDNDDSPPMPGDGPHGRRSSDQHTTSREHSPVRKSSTEGAEIDAQPVAPTGSQSKSKFPEFLPKRKTAVSGPGGECPSGSPDKPPIRSRSPVRAKSCSRSPSPESTSSSPEKVKVKSRSSSPGKERLQSRSVKDKASSRSHSPVKARSRSPASEKRSASSSSDDSDKEVTLKMQTKNKDRGRVPVRSRRPPSSSSSRSRSESSSSSGSSRSRSRSRSLSTSPQKKRARRVSRSASRSRSRSPERSHKKAVKKEDSRKKNDDGASTAERKEEGMETSKSNKPVQELEDKKPDVNGGSGEFKMTERVPVVRRRRWGSTRTTTTKAAIVVSTDSLKGLIPEIKPSALSQEPVLELAPPEEEEEKMDQEEAEEDTFKKDLKIQRTVTQEVNSSAVKVKESPPVPPPATVPENDDVRQVEVGEISEETVVREEKKKEESPKEIRKPRRSMDVSVIADEPQPSRRSPSPARNPVSCIIHIRNLVRPYTLRQLKEVLGRTGTLVENGFWIDNIKSHAYATFESEDQAKASRQALHGTRWPSSNPKLLRIEYATQDEVDYHKSGDVTPASIKRQVRQDVSAKPAAPPIEDPLRGIVAEGRSRKEDLRLSRLDPVREWDRDKVRQSRSRSRERRESDRRRTEDRSREKSREQEKKKRDRSKERKERKEKKDETEEAPAKLLDDLFCKTKATPCIYWLPLTEEQALQRAQRIKAQEEERERRRKDQVKKDEELRRQREKDREDRLRHRDGPQRRSPDRGRPGDRGPDKNRDNRGRRSRSRSRAGRRR